MKKSSTSKRGLVVLCIGSLLSINVYAQPGYFTGEIAYWATKGFCYKQLQNKAVEVASVKNGKEALAVTAIGVAITPGGIAMATATAATIETTARSVGTTVAILTPFLP